MQNKLRQNDLTTDNNFFLFCVYHYRFHFTLMDSYFSCPFIWAYSQSAAQLLSREIAPFHIRSPFHNWRPFLTYFQYIATCNSCQHLYYAYYQTQSNHAFNLFLFYMWCLISFTQAFPLSPLPHTNILLTFLSSLICHRLGR